MKLTKFFSAALVAVMAFLVWPMVGHAQTTQEVARLRAATDLARSQIKAHGTAIVAQGQTLQGQSEMLTEIGGALAALAPVIAGMPAETKARFDALTAAVTNASAADTKAITALETKVRAMFDEVATGCAKYADAETQKKCLEIRVSEVEALCVPHENTKHVLDTISDVLRTGTKKEWKCKRLAPAGAGNNPPALVECGWIYTPVKNEDGVVEIGGVLGVGADIDVTYDVGASEKLPAAELTFRITAPEIPPARRAKAKRAMAVRAEDGGGDTVPASESGQPRWYLPRLEGLFLSGPGNIQLLGGGGGGGVQFDFDKVSMAITASAGGVAAMGGLKGGAVYTTLLLEPLVFENEDRDTSLGLGYRLFMADGADGLWVNGANLRVRHQFNQWAEVDAAGFIGRGDHRGLETSGVSGGFILGGAVRF